MALQTIHKGVEISLDLWQDGGGKWTGKCELTKPNGHTEVFVPTRAAFLTREFAKDSAIEEARRYIETLP